MRILLTGATGYVGQRLLPVLVEAGHHVACMTRDRDRLDLSPYEPGSVSAAEADLADPASLKNISGPFDVAYYLVHSMASDGKKFEEKERQSARNFTALCNRLQIRQVIYLGGIINENEKHLSPHLRSRLQVEKELEKGNSALTVLRAGIILGSGSASFEIIRDLVEKLPVMITPRWVRTKCQPIAIRNVIHYLLKSAGNEETFGRIFDIGGPDILTYQEMLMQFAHIRGLKRLIFPVPLLTPKLSSFWLYWITSVTWPLAKNLVNSMKVEVIVHRKGIEKLIPQTLLTFEEAVRAAFEKIEQNMVVSSWRDAASSGYHRHLRVSDFVEVPENGVLHDRREVGIKRPVGEVVDNIWRIGGKQGWYYGTVLWRMRGWIDQLFGGVGLRRGRRPGTFIRTGDAIDFWRVILADRRQQRLLLFAEMKLPGEAWLEFRIENAETEPKLVQEATFRPKGLKGRLYWYFMYPFHLFLFGGMAKKIARS